MSRGNLYVYFEYEALVTSDIPRVVIVSIIYFMPKQVGRRKPESGSVLQADR